MSVQVECSGKDLHSGVYGGSVHEAMTDLITLMGKRGFHHGPVTWGRSWRGLVSGRPQHLAQSHSLWTAFGSFPFAASFRSPFPLKGEDASILPLSPWTPPCVTKPCLTSGTQPGQSLAPSSLSEWARRITGHSCGFHPLEGTCPGLFDIPAPQRGLPLLCPVGGRPSPILPASCWSRLRKLCLIPGLA